MFKKCMAGFTAVITAVMLFPFIVNADVIQNGTGELYYYYGLLPANVQTHLENINCTITIDGKKMRRVVVLGDENNEILAENVGLTRQEVDDYGFVRSAAIYVKEGHEEALLHEVGHVIANYKGGYNGWCETDAWKYIYEREAPFVLMDPYAVSSPSEYMAESFSWYILYSDELARTAPMTWQYINAMVERTGNE